MGQPRTIAAIPVRLEASRLPGKPLVDLGGRSVVLRVLDAVRDCRRLQPVVVTDAPAVAAHVEAAGGTVLLDPRPARTGSDRIAAALSDLPGGMPPDDGWVLNVQGDQPGLRAAALGALLDAAAAAPADCALLTLSAPLDGDPADPARVKVVTDATGRALFFSRAPLPHGGPHRVHLGVYAFRVAALRRMAALPTGPLERSESLEQLRLLEDGARIDVLHLARGWSSIDTPADVARWHHRAGRLG